MISPLPWKRLLIPYFSHDDSSKEYVECFCSKTHNVLYLLSNDNQKEIITNVFNLLNRNKRLQENIWYYPDRLFKKEWNRTIQIEKNIFLHSKLLYQYSQSCLRKYIYTEARTFSDLKRSSCKWNHFKSFKYQLFSFWKTIANEKIHFPE